MRVYNGRDSETEKRNYLDQTIRWRALKLFSTRCSASEIAAGMTADQGVECGRVRLVLHSPAGLSPVDAARLVNAYPVRSKTARGYVLVTEDRLVRVRHGRPWCVAAPLAVAARRCRIEPGWDLGCWRSCWKAYRRDVTEQ